MFEVRPMSAPERGLAVNWAAREGWNPGLFDAVTFGAQDPDGFFLGCLDDKPVGSISAVRYGERFAFIGFFIVLPEYRGNGYGERLWHAAMEYAGDRNVGLDGVLAQVPRYQRSGFALDYSNVRYRGAGAAYRNGERETAPVDASLLGDVLAYDRACFPAERDAFLRAWLAAPETVVRCVRDERGAMRGFAVMRRCREGRKIGPLFADDPSTARRLLHAMLAIADPGEAVFFDVPAVHEAAVALAREAGMISVFETARMYTKGRPKFALERCYGVTSFELG